MAPKAFEAGIYALENAFGVLQPDAGIVNPGHLQATFTLPGSTASRRNLAQRMRRKDLPWNQGYINSRRGVSDNHQTHYDAGLLEQDITMNAPDCRMDTVPTGSSSWQSSPNNLNRSQYVLLFIRLGFQYNHSYNLVNHQSLWRWTGTQIFLNLSSTWIQILHL